MIEFFAYVNDDLQLENPKVVEKAFGKLTPGRWRFRIEIANKRSLQQNAYYWKVVVPLVKDGLRNAGWEKVRTDYDAHKMMKREFLKETFENHKTGEIVEIPGSTKGLSTIQFMTYIESIIQWGAEYLGIQIPYPNEQLYIA